MTDTPYCPFIVGQHVVCVDDDFGLDRSTAQQLGCELPVAGVVYSVREVLIFPDQDHPAVRLVEIINPVVTAQWSRTRPVRALEPPFSARRFRPAPSIAALQAIATGAPVKKHEPA